MADRDAIERRLLRAGLDEEQAQAVLESTADMDELQQWVESVHDDDIKEKYVEAAAEVDGSAGGSGDPINY